MTGIPEPHPSETSLAPEHEVAESLAQPSGVRRNIRTRFLISLLLLVQGIERVYNGIAIAVAIPNLRELALLPQTLYSAGLITYALLALIASLGYIVGRPSAWVIAMLLQGASIFIALYFYFFLGDRSYYTFIVMGYSILMIIFLYYNKIQAVLEDTPIETLEHKKDVYL